MIVGAFVFEDTIFGMIEASQMRKASIPRSLQIGCHHRKLVMAHAAGADGMMVGLGMLASVLEEVVIRNLSEARQSLGEHERLQGAPGS